MILFMVNKKNETGIKRSKKDILSSIFENVPK